MEQSSEPSRVHLTSAAFSRLMFEHKRRQTFAQFANRTFDKHIGLDKLSTKKSATFDSSELSNLRIPPTVPAGDESSLNKTVNSLSLGASGVGTPRREGQDTSVGALSSPPEGVASEKVPSPMAASPLSEKPVLSTSPDTSPDYDIGATLGHLAGDGGRGEASWRSKAEGSPLQVRALTDPAEKGDGEEGPSRPKPMTECLNSNFPFDAEARWSDALGDYTYFVKPKVEDSKILNWL